MTRRVNQFPEGTEVGDPMPGHRKDLWIPYTPSPRDLGYSDLADEQYADPGFTIIVEVPCGHVICDVEVNDQTCVINQSERVMFLTANGHASLYAGYGMSIVRV